MKALKEKRVSLRSFIRRGLVILSLFALAFASCGDSGSEEEPTQPSNGTTPTQPARYVTAIVVKQQPTEESFQGMPPNLTGMVAEVTWSDGEKYDEYDWTKFVGVPNYCDIPSAYETSAVTTNGVQKGKYQVQYAGQATGITSRNLEIPFVVAASSIHVTKKASTEWYVDETFNFTGLTLNIDFDQGWKGFGPRWDGYVDSDNVTPTNKVLTKAIKLEREMTTAYPEVQYGNAQFGGQLTASIGDLGGLSPDSTQQTSVKTATFTIDKYYGIAAVEFVRFDSLQNYFHDDIDVWGSIDNTGKFVPELTKVYKALKESGAMFKVSYYDAMDPTLDSNFKRPIVRTREITAAEFAANNEYYQRLLDLDPDKTFMVSGTGQKVVSTTDGITDFKSGGIVTNESLGKIFKLGGTEDDDITWNVTLDYVPWRYNSSATLGSFQVPFEMWSYDSDMRAQRALPGEVTIDGSYTPVSMTDEQIRGIQEKWVLLGKYTKGSRSIEKNIKLTKQMFYDGYYGASVQPQGWGVTSLNTCYTKISTGDNSTLGTKSWDSFHANVSAIGYNSMGGPTNTAGLEAGAGGQRLAFPLPLYYRGYLIYDEDETVVVNLNPPRN